MKDQQLTPPEWHLMECLWVQSPRTGREAVEFMKRSVGWSRSTTLTVLRRLTEKGFIECRTDRDVLTYVPLLDREAAVNFETHSFLDRVYRGSASLFVSAITKKQALSQEEIEVLQRILDKIEEGEEND